MRHALVPSLTVLLALIVLCSGQASAQSTPQGVARQLQQRYASLNSLEATFVQRIGAQTREGTLSVRGHAFRLGLPDQTLVTDGETLWSYSRPDRQVIIQRYDPDEIGFSVGQLFTDYLAVFRATGATRAVINGVEHQVLSLRPREAGTSIRDVTLYVRTSDAVPTRVRVHDMNGQTLAFDLGHVRVNPSLTASTFRFQAPQDVEVVDLRP